MLRGDVGDLVIHEFVVAAFFQGIHVPLPVISTAIGSAEQIGIGQEFAQCLRITIEHREGIAVDELRGDGRGVFLLRGLIGCAARTQREQGGGEQGDKDAVSLHARTIVLDSACSTGAETLQTGGIGRLCDALEPCENRAMPITALRCVPIALAVTFVLAACGGEGGTEADVERGASGVLQLTLCVDNQSTRAISSSGNGSPTQPEGFVVRPGQRACASAAPNYGDLTQQMMSDLGSAWKTNLNGNFNFGAAYAFETCGRRWSNEATFSADMTCSGNPFRIDGTIDANSDTQRLTAEIVFSDQ